MPLATFAFENVSAEAGSKIVLAPSGVGSGTLQWQFNGNDLLNATNASLTLEAVTANDSGSYRLVVSDSQSGGTNSSFDEGVVTVLPSSVVRFETVLGVIDLQLFDRIKPVTVDNFLRYVRTGTYKDLFFHRLIPDFVLQGGGFVSPARVSTNVFDSYNNVTNFGTIVNEFSTFDPIANRYGTIAMAKMADNPNSASSQWFFNLADNGGLDTQNGGFTVFGRVISGTNVLEQFKALSKSNGIVDLVSFYGQGASVFSDLPVQYTGFRTPKFNELSYVSLSLISSPFSADAAKPTVSISSPAENLRVASGSTVLAGTAGDNIGVARVVYRIGTNRFQVAAGTTNWSVPLNFAAGSYDFTVQSEDGAGNISSQVTRHLSITPRLNVQTVGMGTVTPVLQSTNLVAGRLYQLKAVPGAGQLFVGWSGGVNYTNPILRFLMPSQLDLTATFASNHFPKVLGTYSGLFYETGQVAVASSGFLNLKVTANGAFSGKVLVGGATLPIKGKFNHLGSTSLSATPRGASPLSFSLKLDLTNGLNQITGLVSNGLWIAALRGNRDFLLEKTNPNSYAKKLAMIFPGDPLSLQQPGGDGFATVTIASNGVVKVAGSLSDDEKFSVATARANDGSWPFYKSLYRGAGVIFGWISDGGSDPQPLIWIKPPLSLAKVYTNGFSLEIAARLSSYSPPEMGSYSVELFGGGLFGTTSVSEAAFGADNRFAVVQSDVGLKVSLAPATGLFKGSFTHPATGQAVLWKGVFFKGSETGHGFYLNPPQSGAVRMFRN